MTHPGVGSLTALAFVLILGRAERFQCGSFGLLYFTISSSRNFSQQFSGNRGLPNGVLVLT